jgi:streptogramin lyase
MPRRSRVLASFVALLLAAFVTSGCYLSHERDRPSMADGDGSVESPSSALVWVLIHPSSAPLEPGIVLFDESRQTVERRLPLPPGREDASVHGLAWDGTSLWLSAVFPPEILELDPETGAVRSRIEGVLAEGLASAPDGTLWYAGTRSGMSGARIANITRTGEELAAIPLPEPVVQDLARVGDRSFYLVNDDIDRIVRVDRAGAPSDLARVPNVAPYSLGFDGRHLAVAVDGAIHRFDPATGALVGSGPLDVPGWITAIAFVR